MPEVREVKTKQVDERCPICGKENIEKNIEEIKNILNSYVKIN